MLAWIREKFGTVIIGGIITFIAFVFVFYGVFSPKATRGLHEGAVAGTVNGDPISISEFNRELNRRMEYFKNITGGKFTDDQLKAFRIRESVFQELANRKMMAQEAQRQGLVAADDKVREKIQEIQAFQKEGRFDLVSYKQVLEANNYTPGGFERLMREDVSLQQWDSYFQNRTRVSEEELKREFNLNQSKRKVKYVYLTTESVKGKVQVSQEDIKKFLADATQMNLAKMKFEEGKDTLYKGQKFEAVQEKIAHDILAGDKRDEIQKIVAQLSDQVVASLKKEKGADAKLNQILKPYGLEVKVSEDLTRRRAYLPQVGEVKELLGDAFAPKSPIDVVQGGKPKKYTVAGQTLIALLYEAKDPVVTQLEQERSTLIQQISMRKSRELLQEWMHNLSAKAKIDMNPAVVGAE